jgi:HEAT repeat protein
MAKAAPGVDRILLGVFGSVGGQEALAAVSASARGSNESLRAAALKVLGEWGHEEAAPVLLELLGGSEDPEYRLQTLNAFSNLVRTVAFPKERRIGVCEKAMGLARTDEERTIVIGALAGIPATETIEVLTGYLATPAIRDAAATAMVTICERLVRTKRDAVVGPMRKVLETTQDEGLGRRARRVLRTAGVEP